MTAEVSDCVRTCMSVRVCNPKSWHNTCNNGCSSCGRSAQLQGQQLGRFIWRFHRPFCSPQRRQQKKKEACLAIDGTHRTVVAAPVLFWGPAVTHTSTHAHTVLACVCSLIGFSFALCFYLFQWFGNKHSQSSSVKRQHLRATERPSSPSPLSIYPTHMLCSMIQRAGGNFWLCWLLDKLPTAANGCGANSLHCRQVFAFVFSFSPSHASIRPVVVAVSVVALSGIDKWCTISALSLTCQ